MINLTPCLTSLIINSVAGCKRTNTLFIQSIGDIVTLTYTGHHYSFLHIITCKLFIPKNNLRGVVLTVTVFIHLFIYYFIIVIFLSCRESNGIFTLVNIVILPSYM